MVRAWVNHYGAMYAALKALHDLARRWTWSGEASSKCKIEKPEGNSVVRERAPHVVDDVVQRYGFFLDAQGRPAPSQLTLRHSRGLRGAPLLARRHRVKAEELFLSLGPR
jgi:hypothetical protein